jgi:O-antigen/teichoic acid export membrane protein
MSAVQSILAGRLLGPSVFGILGAVTSFTSVVNRFASFRMNELVIKYVGHYQERGEPHKAATVFRLAGLLELGSSFAAFLLIFFLAPLGARFFARDATLVFWFRLYGSIILANIIFESATGLLQIFDRFHVIAIINVVQSSLTLFLVVIAFFAKLGLEAVVIAYMVGKVVGSLAISIMALVEAQKIWGSNWWRVKGSFIKTEYKSLFTFAFSTNLSGTISLVAKDSEVLWVSAFLGTQQAGLYKTALALTGLIQLPISPLPKTTFPELAREIARKNWVNVRYVLRQGSRLAALYSIPVTAVLILIGRWGIGLTYGLEFIRSYEPLVILLIGFTFSNIFYWNRVALLSLAHPVFPTIVNFIGMIIKVSLIFLFVPVWGYLGFAGLLAGYYIFTVGIAAVRVGFDLHSRFASQPVE